MPTAPGDWDAGRYHQVARPHATWGATVIDRLELSGDEVVLDAGCGSGRVTAQLLERLPRGRVIAADQSPAMLAEARKALATWAEEDDTRVSFVEADLLEIDHVLDERVDVVFSTAVFHWIADHPRLFTALRGVLRPSGYLVAQCGGAGNLASFMRAADVAASRAPFAAVLQGLDLWRFFYTPEETEARLLAAGFSRARAWLEPSPQQFSDASALADFCRAVVLTSHVAALPATLRDDFVDQVVVEIAHLEGAFTLDYVRLNMQASA
jgi:trans-aconitate 2-methyltransferase